MKKIIPLMIFYSTANALFTYKVYQYYIKKLYNK